MDNNAVSETSTVETIYANPSAADASNTKPPPVTLLDKNIWQILFLDQEFLKECIRQSVFPILIGCDLLQPFDHSHKIVSAKEHYLVLLLLGEGSKLDQLLGQSSRAKIDNLRRRLQTHSYESRFKEVGFDGNIVVNIWQCVYGGTSCAVKEAKISQLSQPTCFGIGLPPVCILASKIITPLNEAAVNIFGDPGGTFSKAMFARSAIEFAGAQVRLFKY